MHRSYSCGGGYTIDYSPNEFSFYKDQGYDRIKAPKFSLHGEPGTPELPAVYLNYIIPPNARAESVIVSQFQYIQIPGEYLIYPAQPPRVIGESVPWVPPDTIIYNSDNLFPGEFIKVVGEGVMDGARIVTVEVKPLQYRPKTKRLYLVRPIDFEFVFSPQPVPELRPRVRGINEQAVYDVALRNVVVNDNEISVYYQKPAIVEESQIGGAAPYPIGPAIIIAPLEFHSAFQPYADWMTDQGIKTYLITPQTIYQFFPGVDNAEKVRNYIKYCYENAGGTYFILGGDDCSSQHINLVPVRWCVEYVDDEDTIIPADLYFSDLTGNWDADGDGRWGEWEDEPDRWPEVFVGRITAYTTQEVTNWVTKALHYEKTPGVIFDTALWIYSSPVGTGNAPSVFPGHISHIFAQDYWADAALYLLSNGYGIMNLNCHGNAGDYRIRHNPNADHHSWWPNPPDPYKAGLNWLTNLNRYFVGYAISCYVGAYDTLAHPIYYENGTDTCIADAYVDAYLYNQQGNLGPFGAVAFLANTRNGLWQGGGPSYDLQFAFWKIIFNPWWVGAPPEPSLTRIGVAESFSKCDEIIHWFIYDHRYVCYGHTLFGSPVTEVWTKTPGNMSVSHPRQIYAGQQVQFTVTVRDALDGRRLQYAKVCLNKPNDIYQVGSTNSNGQVTFTITPQSSGTMKITVTRLHNADNLTYNQYRPSQTTCLVLEPLGGGQSSDSDELLPTSLCITHLPALAEEKLAISYGIPEPGDVLITVYDITGSVVKSITHTYRHPGYYQKTISAEGLSSGIYFLVVRQNNEKVSKKFLLIK